MKKILYISLLMLVLLFSSVAYSNNVDDILDAYQKCKDIEICKEKELQLIKLFLSKQNILDLLEEMPADEDIKYEILQSNISNPESKDYIIKIVIDNLGYLVILKHLSEKDQYLILPIIEKGFIYDLQTKDLTGDGIREIIISGIGRGTGYRSDWTAIYKYKNTKMNLIWSGFNEEDSYEGSVQSKMENSIYFYNVPGLKTKEINYTIVSEYVDSGTNKFVSKKVEEKVFKWSNADFKFVE